jgi:hypothetical protein
MSGHDQANRQEEHLHDLLSNGVQRVGQDALKRHATFLDRGNDASEPGFGQDRAGSRFGDVGCRRDRDANLRLAQCRRVVGTVAAHADDMAALLECLDELVLALRKEKILAGHIDVNMRALLTKDVSGW